MGRYSAHSFSVEEDTFIISSHDIHPLALIITIIVTFLERLVLLILVVVLLALADLDIEPLIVFIM